MNTCKRCGGFIQIPIWDNSDPVCINCGREYPGLGASAPFSKRKNKRGLRETIRYSGQNKLWKENLGYINYIRHPTKRVGFPCLEVECPLCGGIVEANSPSTVPSASMDHIYGSSEAKGSPLACPRNHLFQLKVNSEGLYSWE